MNHFLSITEILLEPIIRMEYPRLLRARIARDLWVQGPAPGCPELLRRLVVRTEERSAGQHEPASQPRPRARQAGDHAAGAVTGLRPGGPGQQRTRAGRISSLWTRVTSVGLFWAGAGGWGEVARLHGG